MHFSEVRMYEIDDPRDRAPDEPPVVIRFPSYPDEDHTDKVQTLPMRSYVSYIHYDKYLINNIFVVYR